MQKKRKHIRKQKVLEPKFPKKKAEEFVSYFELTNCPGQWGRRLLKSEAKELRKSPNDSALYFSLLSNILLELRKVVGELRCGRVIK